MGLELEMVSSIGSWRWTPQVRTVLNGGWAGRDQAAVAAHIKEMQALGGAAGSCGHEGGVRGGGGGGGGRRRQTETGGGGGGAAAGARRGPGGPGHGPPPARGGGRGPPARGARGGWAQPSGPCGRSRRSG